jgi:decaprenylphospho-beta-D-ribofuranose 2-oxidase
MDGRDPLQETPHASVAPPRHELLEGWGRTPRSAADVYVIDDARDLPPTLAAVRCAAAAEGAAPAVLARGLGRSYGDASLNAGGAVFDLAAVAGIRKLDLEEGTATVGAGMSFDVLIRALLPLGFFVPVTPGTRYVTMGGAIAADIHGKNHHTDGSLQRHLLSFELVTPDGRTRSVTPASDPDVFAATAGGMGLTGVITEATLSLVRVETAYMSVDTERIPNLDVALDRMLSTDDRYRYSVAWVDCLARGRTLGRSVLMRGNHATRDALPAKLRAAPLRFDTGVSAAFPPGMPRGLLNPRTNAAFNEVIFRRAPAERHGHIERIAPFFHPLDSVAHWNRAYGGRGFVQYQFVVPYGEEDALRSVLDALSSRRVPSFVSVLKRLGPGCGMLSFPISGWTLAIDIPTGVADLDEMLDAFDRTVANAGGRVYLAKDARLKPAAFREMYPEFERWNAVRAQLDPAGVWRSDLARRLELV